MAIIRPLNKDSETLIKQWEGKAGKAVLIAYRDSGGVFTIGWGHTGPVDGVKITRGMRITNAKAQELFDEDIEVAANAVHNALRVTVTDNQYGALVSWTLNVGVAAMRGSTLMKKLNQGHHDAVPKELMRWVKDRDPRTGKLVTVKGLVNRRAADAGLWAKGSFVRSSIAYEAHPEPDRVHNTEVTTAVAAGGAGSAMTLGPAIPEIIDSVSYQQMELTSGDVIRIVIAIIIVGLTAYTIWRKMKGGES